MPPFLNTQEEIQKYGEEQYRLRNYKQALKAFSEALALGPDSISLLDARAASYCALDDLESALKDARRMTKSSKNDPRGYLRTAMVLQLMKKFEEAEKVYEYALRTVGEENAEGRKQIETLLRKLKRARNPPQIDPFVFLPPELVSAILEFCDLPTTMKIIRVSKLWNTLGIDLSQIWLDLDLTDLKKTVSISTIRAFLRKKNGKLKRLVLANLNENDAPKIWELVSRCTGMEHYEVHMVSLEFSLPIERNYLKSVVIHYAAYPMHTFLEVLSSCPSLERLKFSVFPQPDDRPLSSEERFPQLRSLKITLTDFGQPSIFRFENIEATLPNLKILDIVGLSRADLTSYMHSQLKSFSYSGVEFSNWPDLPAKIEHLSISQAPLHPFDSDFDELDIKLCNLRTLGLEEVLIFRPELIGQILEQNSTTLTTLSLHRMAHLGQNDIINWLERGFLQSLTNLDLCGLPALDDNITPYLNEHIPNLKAVDLSLSKISGLTIKDLVDSKTPGLQRITVPPVARDAIDYGRNRGVEIVIRSQPAMRSQRGR